MSGPLMKAGMLLDLRATGWMEIPRDAHDVLCTVRIGTLQESGVMAGLLACTSCGLFYAPPKIEEKPMPADLPHTATDAYAVMKSTALTAQEKEDALDFLAGFAPEELMTAMQFIRAQRADQK